MSNLAKIGVYIIGKRDDFNSSGVLKFKAKLDEENYEIIDFTLASADSPTDKKHEEWLNKSDFVAIFMSNKWFIEKDKSDIFQEVAYVLESEKGKQLIEKRRIYWFSLDSTLDLGKVKAEVKRHWLSEENKNVYTVIDNKEDIPTLPDQIDIWVIKTFENIKNKHVLNEVESTKKEEQPLKIPICSLIMTSKVHTVYPTDTLSTVDRLAYESIRHFPVVRDETIGDKMEKVLLGIFSRRDAVKQSPLAEVKNTAIKLGSGEKTTKIDNLTDPNISQKGFTSKKDNSYFYDITEDAEISEAIYYLKDRQPVSGYSGQMRMISALPVVEYSKEGNLAILRGIISYIDILKKIKEIAGSKYDKIAKTMVSSLMKTDVEYLSENNTLKEAHSIVKNQGVRTIIVVEIKNTEGDKPFVKIKGILTDYELYKNYVEDFTGNVPLKIVMSKLVNDFNKATPLLNELKITKDSTIEDLIKKLEKKENRAFTSIPVIGDNFELLGIIGYVDVLRLLFDEIK